MDRRGLSTPLTHEVGSGAVYTWRRQAMSGELTGVRPPALPAFFEVEVANPVVRLTVDAMVDADALARVIAVLDR